MRKMCNEGEKLIGLGSGLTRESLPRRLSWSNSYQLHGNFGKAQIDFKLGNVLIIF